MAIASSAAILGGAAASFAFGWSDASVLVAGIAGTGALAISILQLQSTVTFSSAKPALLAAAATAAGATLVGLITSASYLDIMLAYAPVVVVARAAILLAAGVLLLSQLTGAPATIEISSRSVGGVMTGSMAAFCSAVEKLAKGKRQSVGTVEHP